METNELKWIKIADKSPEIGEEVIFFNKEWIDEDFNPRGIRIGFKTDEDYISAHWWDYQDTYMTISHSECDDNECYSSKIKDNINPSHWLPIILPSIFL